VNVIKQFLSANKISAHSAVAAWLFLVGAYATIPEFHALVTSYYSLVPDGIKSLVTGLAPVIALYWRTRKSS
jgi:hypothetical protein